MCFDLPLRARLLITQTYAALIEQDPNSLPPGFEQSHRFPRVQDFQRIAALFGKNLPEPDSPDQIEEVICHFVKQKTPFLLPLFAHVPSAYPLFWKHKDYKCVADFIGVLEKIDWKKSLISQFSSHIPFQNIIDLRGFLFQALLEIKRSTASLPHEKQQQCLMSFLFYCISEHLETASIFASFGWKKGIEDSGLCEEDLVCFLSNYLQQTGQSEQVISWMQEWSLSDDGQVEIALELVKRLGKAQFCASLPHLCSNPSQSLLFLKRYVEKYGESLDEFKDLPLNESQWFELALHCEGKYFSYFLSNKEQFPLFSKENYAEIIMRCAQAEWWIERGVKEFNISDEDLLWKIFLTSVLRDLQLDWKERFSDASRREFYEALKKGAEALQNPILQQSESASLILQSLRESGFVDQWGIKEALELHFKSITAAKRGKLDALFWLLRFMGRCMAQEVPLAEALTHPFVESALALRDPEMRETLAPKILSLLYPARSNAPSSSAQGITDPSRRKYADMQLASKKSRERFFPKHARLPLLLLSLSLDPEGIPQELCNPLVDLSRDRIFKDAQNLQTYLAALTLILEEKSWSQEDKNHLLSLIVSTALPKKSASDDSREDREC